MNSEINKQNRMRTFIGAMITEFALGSVYTWSLFNAPLSKALHSPIKTVAFTFGLMSLALAIGSSVSGKIQDRFGITKTTIAAGLILGLSLIITSFAGNILMLYLFGGILVGLGDGIGYLMTLSNCVKQFPEKKGLISAFTIGAYGLGALGFKFINNQLLIHEHMHMTFEIWGILMIVLVAIGGLLMSDAPEVKSTVQAADGHSEEKHQFDLKECLNQKSYWTLALIFVTICMSGLYVIGVSKDIGEIYAHLSTATATSAVAIVAAANLLGRLILGVLSDKIKRIYTISIALIFALIGIILILFVHLNPMLYWVSLSCMAFCFGGGITVYPSLVSDFFGLRNLTKNYGLIYLGFGIGSFIGSAVASLFGGFIATFWLILSLLIISLVLTFVVRAPKNPTVEVA
ncbi:OFA family MFS transporter [Persicobacter psychrovividus]